VKTRTNHKLIKNIETNNIFPGSRTLTSSWSGSSALNEVMLPKIYQNYQQSQKQIV